MSRFRFSCLLSALLLSACASAPPEAPRIVDLKDKPLILPPVKAAEIKSDAASTAYHTFLKDAPNDPAYREALRRSADIELESAQRPRPASITPPREKPSTQEAIRLYREYLNKYPEDGNNEQVLYQLAKAYDLSGQLEDSLATLQQLLHQYPKGQYAEEALFRSGEANFSLRQYIPAEHSFRRIIQKYPNTLYFEGSLYMLGWSLYLQNRFEDSLQTFLDLLDRKLSKTLLAGDELSKAISPADRELLDDSLKVICLALSYQGISNPIDYNFDRHGDRPYEALIYRRLGEFYLGKQRYLDAAHAFMNMTRRLPNHELAPQFHQYAIKAYEKGGFTDLFFDAKSTFVKKYGVSSHYWQSHEEGIHQRLRSYLAKDIKDLAAHYHHLARHGKKIGDFDAAVSWYREYIRTFPSGADTAEMNFMLAECLHDAGRYQDALTEYERSAYHYPSHQHGAESGYAALLAYKEIISRLPDEQRDQWRRRSIASALRFSEHFPNDSRVDKVLANTVDELYTMHDYAGTIDAAQRLLARPDRGNTKARRDVWIILGHARSTTGDYVGAQKAYQTALKLLPAGDPQRPGIIDNLAASMYKQGEQLRTAGDLRGAIALFLRIEQEAPAPSIWMIAKYDAAAALIQLKDWNKAATVLEELHRSNPAEPHLRHGVSEKLALVYMQTGQKWKAAREMETLAASDANPAKRQELVWEAATLYRENGATIDAVRLYRRFINEFPTAFDDSIEARHFLSVLYTKLGKPKRATHWLNEIIKADAASGAARTDRSRQLAGEATLIIAQPLLQDYRRARLTLPLKKSLKAKKALMEKAIAAYKKALAYQVAEVSTAATYQLGNIYDHFSRAITASERPRGLSKAELEQYNILLEDQSYQFQDKAIQLYEANLKHIGDGIYDDSIKASLKALAILYPVRYAKTEKSEIFFDADP